MKTTLNKLSAIAIGTFLSTAAFTTLTTAAQAATLTQWNFNGSGLSTTSPATSTGVGTASLIGGTTASFANGNADGGSTDPLVTGDQGWNVTTFPAQGTGDKTAGVQFNVSTLGFQNIIISFDQRHSNSAAKDVIFQYTTNGSIFTDFANFSATAGDTWFNIRTVDLSSIAGVNDNANFGFRIVAAFAPSTSTYVQSDSVAPITAYGSGGTNRFDMVTVSADPVPEPTTIATGLLAVGAGRMIQRKRQKATKAAVK
jgi:hypothetical protein